MRPRDRLFRTLMSADGDQLRRLAGTAVVVDGQTLDVQTQLMLTGMRWLGVVRGEEVEQARAREEREVAAVAPAPVPLASERDVLVPGAAGNDMRVRVYHPRSARAGAGLLVYFHGGGFVTGGLGTHDLALRWLAHESGVHVAAVEYRLGPEAMFPAALEDALAAYVWGRTHAGELGASPARVGVGGDSAGGNLAAVVCHLAAEKPAHQLLLYPAIDWSRSYASHRTFAAGYLLEEARTFWYEKHYLHDLGERDDPRASPLRFERFDGLPPATIVTVGFDILRDEGLAYARALATARVPVDYTCEQSLIHGFVVMTGAISAARGAMTRVAKRLQEALG